MWADLLYAQGTSFLPSYPRLRLHKPFPCSCSPNITTVSPSHQRQQDGDRSSGSSTLGSCSFVTHLTIIRPFPCLDNQIVKMLSFARVFFLVCHLVLPPFLQGKISWRVKSDITFAGSCRAVQPFSSLSASQVAAVSDLVLCSLLLLFFFFSPHLSYLLLYFNSLV